jgi:hypothetical protein
LVAVEIDVEIRNFLFFKLNFLIAAAATLLLKLNLFVLATAFPISRMVPAAVSGSEVELSPPPPQRIIANDEITARHAKEILIGDGLMAASFAT